ncbi:MAG: hypothetical protein ACLP8X_25170 [Streptosporangiaceae bacterium]
MAWEELRQLEGIRRQAAGAGLVAYAFDHPDYYPSQDAVEKAFGELLARTLPGARVFACGNSAGVRAVTGAHDRLTTFGFGAGNAMRVGLLGGQVGEGYAHDQVRREAWSARRSGLPTSPTRSAP